MTLQPTLKATIRFTTGPAFGNVLVLGSAADGILGTNVLGTQATIPVDITATVTAASVRRGRTRILDRFEAGSATIQIIDTDGTFDPINGPYAADLKPLRQIRLYATHNGVERYLFSGFIDSLDYSYDIGADVAYVTFSCTDTFRLLNLAKISTVTGGVAGQTTGARIESILDQIAWPESLLDADVGDSTVQADDGSSRTVLDAIQAVAESEVGALYMTAAGIVRFVSRHGTIQAADQIPLEFNDTGTGITYSGIDFNFDDTLISNVVTVTNTGGTPQTVSDQISIDTYFDRDYTLTDLLLEADSEALNVARTVLAARKDPKLRIESIALNLSDGNLARINAALDTDFYRSITVSRAQPGGGSISQTLTVQGIQHDVTPDSWITTFSTSELLATGFVVGSVRNGVLGTDILGY
jgi:hypothetical protein